jgi:hypothetical protein
MPVRVYVLLCAFISCLSTKGIFFTTRALVCVLDLGKSLSKGQESTYVRRAIRVLRIRCVLYFEYLSPVLLVRSPSDPIFLVSASVKLKILHQRHINAHNSLYNTHTHTHDVFLFFKHFLKSSVAPLKKKKRWISPKLLDFCLVVVCPLFQSNRIQSNPIQYSPLARVVNSISLLCH